MEGITGEARHSGNVELAFLGHPLERLGRALDSVLAVIAFRWKQPEHLIGAAGGRSCDVAGSKVDGLTDSKFVLQRLLPSRKNAGHAYGPAATAD
jgi:hypothetical protein